jgi:hypothetical protein
MTERGNDDDDDDVEDGTPQHIAVPAFLPEPLPFASHGGGAGGNSRAHVHDTFSDNDSGVDYGPPNESEDDNEDDVEEEDEEGGGGRWWGMTP